LCSTVRCLLCHIQRTTHVNTCKQVESFRRLLLNRCQEEFIRIKTQTLNETPNDADDDKKQLEKFKARKKKLGVIAFIGELFMRHMLSYTVMRSCISMLFGNDKHCNAKDIEVCVCACVCVCAFYKCM